MNAHKITFGLDGRNYRSFRLDRCSMSTPQWTHTHPFRCCCYIGGNAAFAPSPVSTEQGKARLERAELPPITEKPFGTNTKFPANRPSSVHVYSLHLHRLTTVKGQIALCDVAHLLHNFHPIPCEKLGANVIAARARLVPPLKTVTE